MFENMPFIGRKEELKIIKRLIQEQGTRRVACIHGAGGIGKTRLLTEVYGQCAKHEDHPLLVADILDFDDRALLSPENLERQIAQRLDDRAFESYLGEFSDWHKMESAGVSQKTLQRQSENVRQAFVDNFNRFSSDRRIVLLLDTTEKLLESDEAWRRLANLIVASKNACFVLAGRRGKALGGLLQTEFGLEVQLIELQPFGELDGQQYLAQKQPLLRIKLEPELKAKLLLLAEGRPILLDLAVEWVSRYLTSDWMIKSSLEELGSLSEAEMAQRKQEFESQLVRHITQIRTPMDRLILVMSQVYPLNPNMIAALLNISEDEAKSLFDEALTYVFVKLLPDGRISLHDEMRRMVNKYVWPEVDPQEDRRRHHSKIATQLFQKEEQRLKDKLREITQPEFIAFEREVLIREQEVINEKWIELALYSDVSSGFDVWKQLVAQRRAENRFRFANRLVKIVQPYFEQFDSNQQIEFKMLKARLASDTGQVHEAENMLHELLALNRGQKELESNLYNALAFVEEKLGKLSQALDHQLKCLNIVGEINQQLVPSVANHLGYIYRRLDKLSEAEKYYNLALNSTDQRNQRLIASLFNNLAYVYGLQKRYDEMELYCEQAIEIWSKIGSLREIGRGETTKAIFCRIRGEYDEAIKLLERAISRYEEPDDHEKISNAYLNLGWTQWYKAQRVNPRAQGIDLLAWNISSLEEARQSLEKSWHIAERYGLESELPSILHRTARLYWHLGRVCKDDSLLSKGRELNKESYQKSKQISDIHITLSSLLAEAEWDYEIGQYDTISDHAQKLASYEQYRDNYPLYFGQIRRIEADIAFATSDLETAFSKYAEGLLLIDQDGGSGPYTTKRELLRLENKIDQRMTVTETEKWVKYLRQEWQKRENEDSRLLLTWCRTQLLRARMPRVIYDSHPAVLGSGGADCADCDCACSLPDLSTQYFDSSLSPYFLANSTFQRPPTSRTLPLTSDHAICYGPYHKAAVLNESALSLLSFFEQPSMPRSLPVGLRESVGDEVLEDALAEMLTIGLLQPAGVGVPELVEQPSRLAAWLHVTDRCNLRCNYCYLPHLRKDMSFETGRKAIEGTFRSAVSHGFEGVKLKYAGGEALICFGLVDELHSYAISLAQQYGLALEGVLLSNGTLLTDEIVLRMQALGLRLMISLDGLGEHHDVQRSYAGGKGSFSDVGRGVEVALRYGLVPDISVTVSGRNADGLPALMEWILERDLPFSLNFYRENELSKSFADLKLDESRIISGMLAAFAVIEGNLPRRSLLASLVDRSNLGGAHLRTCGVGQSYLVFDYRGRVSKCQMQQHQPITTVEAADPLALIRADTLGIQNLSVEEKEGCRDCEWKYWCTGGCSLATFRATGRYDIQSPNCNIYKALYPEAVRLEGLRLLRYAQKLG